MRRKKKKLARVARQQLAAQFTHLINSVPKVSKKVARNREVALEKQAGARARTAATNGNLVSELYTSMARMEKRLGKKE